MTTPSVPVSPGDALRQVGQHIRDAARDLTAVAPRITDVHAVMVGLEDITAALTDLVDALTGATPALFGGNGHGALGDELLRDLRAARGCLTTAGLLVAPAVTDLRQLADGTLSAIPRPHAEALTPVVAIMDGDALPPSRDITPTRPAPEASP